MKIEFFIPENETIPTALRLKVNDTYDVFYKRLPDKFAYAFTFFKSEGMTEERARLITEAIIDRMVDLIFDYDGKRYMYYNCFVESIAEIGE